MDIKNVWIKNGLLDGQMHGQNKQLDGWKENQNMKKIDGWLDGQKKQMGGWMNRKNKEKKLMYRKIYEKYMDC